MVKILLNEEQRLALRGLRGKYTAHIIRDDEGWHLGLTEVKNDKPNRNTRSTPTRRRSKGKNP